MLQFSSWQFKAIYFWRRKIAKGNNKIINLSNINKCKAVEESCYVVRKVVLQEPKWTFTRFLRKKLSDYQVARSS